MLGNPQFQSFNYFCIFSYKWLNSFSLHEYLLCLQYVKFGVPVGEDEARIGHMQFRIPSKEYTFKDRNCTLGNDLLKLTIKKYDSKVTISEPG